MFTAMFSAASIVWDREFGFLREMMVAPVRRSSIVIGKCLGGATVASFQGVIVIASRASCTCPYDPLLILGIFVLQLLLAFAITAFGVMIAVRIKQMQSFMGVMQMIVMPMFFISGALFPVAGLPGWLTVLNRLDPLTYAVDPMRRLVFDHLTISPAARHALDPGVTWWGWHVPGAARGRRDRRARAGDARDRDLGVQHHRVGGIAEGAIPWGDCRGAMPGEAVNGLHDTADAMATSIATGALKPGWRWRSWRAELRFAGEPRAPL